jgi:hypothetical protein
VSLGKCRESKESREVRNWETRYSIVVWVFNSCFEISSENFRGTGVSPASFLNVSRNEKTR